MGEGRKECKRQAAGTAECTQEDRGDRAGEERDRWSRQGPRRPQGTRKGQQQREGDRGVSGRGPSSCLSSSNGVAKGQLSGSAGGTYDFMGQNVTLLKKYLKSNFPD